MCYHFLQHHNTWERSGAGVEGEEECQGEVPIQGCIAGQENLLATRATDCSDSLPRAPRITASKNTLWDEGRGEHLLINRFPKKV